MCYSACCRYSVLPVLEVPEVMSYVLLCMLEMLEMLEGMRCILGGMRFGGDALGTGGDARGGCRGRALFAGGFGCAGRF